MDAQVFHTTYASKSILAQGFRDGEGHYLTDRRWRGVWLSDRPLDINEGAKGDTTLALDIPIHVFVEFEWMEEGKPYRESLIPATIVNRYGPPEVYDPDIDG